MAERVRIVDRELTSGRRGSSAGQTRNATAQAGRQRSAPHREAFAGSRHALAQQPLSLRLRRCGSRRLCSRSRPQQRCPVRCRRPGHGPNRRPSGGTPGQCTQDRRFGNVSPAKPPQARSCPCTRHARGGRCIRSGRYCCRAEVRAKQSGRKSHCGQTSCQLPCTRHRCCPTPIVRIPLRRGGAANGEGRKRMNLAFAGCEIDLDRQQLRLAGPIVHLKPQVHDLLTHLLRNRDRVVSKAELLDEATLFSPRNNLDGRAGPDPAGSKRVTGRLKCYGSRLRVRLPKTNSFEAPKLNSSRHPGRGTCCATRWSRSERSSICGMSGKDRQAWRARRAVP